MFNNKYTSDNSLRQDITKKSKLMAMKFIPFGDSHSYFWGRQRKYPGESQDEDVPCMAWLGPAKAYGVYSATENKTKEKLSQILQEPEIIPVACFGEIDVRVNCARNFLFTGSENIVSDLVDNYLASHVGEMASHHFFAKASVTISAFRRTILQIAS
jgi:hypothetical protein